MGSAGRGGGAQYPSQGCSWEEDTPCSEEGSRGVPRLEGCWAWVLGLRCHLAMTSSYSSAPSLWLLFRKRGRVLSPLIGLGPGTFQCSQLCLSGCPPQRPLRSGCLLPGFLVQPPPPPAPSRLHLVLSSSAVGAGRRRILYQRFRRTLMSLRRGEPWKASALQLGSEPAFEKVPLDGETTGGGVRGRGRCTGW